MLVVPAFIKEQLMWRKIFQQHFLLHWFITRIIYTGNHKLADLFELLSDVLQ